MATRSNPGCFESAVTFWASMCLAVTSVTSLLLRYVVDHVTCWTPAQFTRPQAVYTNRICFQQQYIFALEEEGPRVLRFTYHQWIPLFLGACAAICLLPDVLWRIMNAFLWLDKDTFLQTVTNTFRGNTGAERHAVMHDLALLLHEAGLKGGSCFLTLATVGRKASVAAANFAVMVLMATVFAPQLLERQETEPDDSRQDMANGSASTSDSASATASISLPVTEFVCYFEIRQLHNVHQYAVQCTMPLAQVYNKGLGFLFYLFLVLFLLCVLDMAVWTARLIMPGLKDAALRRYLAVVVKPSDRSSDSASLDSFLQSLGPDGRLLLAMTGDCCGPLAATDLTNHLWAVFNGTPRPGSDPPLTSVGSAHSSAPPIQMSGFRNKDGGDFTVADDGNEKPC